jgi:ribonuclease D
LQSNCYTWDIPETLHFEGAVAVDTETMGLCPHRDRLCLVQLSAGDGHAHFVHFPEPFYQNSLRLCALLQNPSIIKIFHYGRFDLSVFIQSFHILAQNVYCTKIASKLTRTYTDKHSLKDLCSELLKINLDKTEQTSDWGGETISEDQRRYAGNDVLYLHALKKKLDGLLLRENRKELAEACFRFLPYRAQLDWLAGETLDIFAHK